MGDSTDVTHLKQVARAQRQGGDAAGAARTLRLAIERAGRELADLHGMLGGALREAGDLAQAAAAYDAGFQLDAQWNPTSTYNELNRLIARVQLAPRSLSDPDELREHAALAFVDVAQQLAAVEAKLRREVAGARRDDYWAAGDLAVAAALDGHLPEAIAAVEQFAARSPPESARAAYAQILAALARLETPRAKVLDEIAARVRGPPG